LIGNQLGNESLTTATSIQSSAGLVDPFAHTKDNVDQYETCWQVPRDIGKGFFCKIEFQSGFALYVMDCLFTECPIVKAAASPSVFCLRFNLSGKNTVRIKGLEKNFSTSAQTNNLYYFKDPSTMGRLPENQHLLGISIHFDTNLFTSLLAGGYVSIPKDLQRIIHGDNIPFFCHTGTTTPNMQITIHQIVNCPYRGLIRRLFLESKALELVSYKLEQMEIRKVENHRGANCRADDVERIRRAGDILIRNMEAPPSLLELGRAVGLSRTKLHVEFCKLYGVTPFAYLREARLNKAKMFIDEGSMNVTEAAMVVGYSSLSHFAKAFREYFGVAPSEYLYKTTASKYSRP
jgi:AraC-like DNA-binding protein